VPSVDEPVDGGWRLPREDLWYVGAVLLGAVLIVITAINQPYNQNEWQQIQFYGSSNLHKIISGTRQPPLDPLLGALVQHLLGVGQLRQRLEPALAGVGSLALMSLLLRRMRLGLIGVLAAFVLATAPIFVRYSAYIRPYALPLFLMLGVCYVSSRWLEDGRRVWIVLAAVGALLLPLTRVPEPTVFLVTSALVLVVLGRRGVLPRVRATRLAVTLIVALVTVGLVSALTLASKTHGVLDLNPVHALRRTPTGAREIVTYVVPLLAHWFPWWPVTVAFLVLAIALPVARRELLGLWFWVPIVLAPIAFLIAYHTVNPYPLDIRHYRARFAYFFAPGFVFLVAAVGRGLAQWGSRRRIGAKVGAIALGVLLVSQLPTTYDVLTKADGPDFGEAGSVLRSDVPHDGVVLYDSPALNGRWRQPFFGRSRYLVDDPKIASVVGLGKGSTKFRGGGPVYILLLDSACATSVVCDLPALPWSGKVDGYRVLRRFSRFTLYAPEDGQHGSQGAVRALSALASAYGDSANQINVFAQARVLADHGRATQAARLLAERCAAEKTKRAADACRKAAHHYGLPIAPRPR
jgi:4-amino-4-deoxy-L-arabinose transferase-like glycosyltransferase